MIKSINTHTKEAQRTPSTRNIKKTIPRFIKIKFLKTGDNEKILKAARKKLHYRETKIMMTDFSPESV